MRGARDSCLFFEATGFLGKGLCGEQLLEMEGKLTPLASKSQAW